MSLIELAERVEKADWPCMELNSAVVRALDELHASTGIACVIHGGANEQLGRSALTVEARGLPPRRIFQRSARCKCSRPSCQSPTGANDMSSGAIISACGTYRYRLERQGRGEGSTAVIMVNPSTADAANDDPTIRRLRGFGERYGWGRIIVGNLFAYRATDVRDLERATDPIGPDNDFHLRNIIGEVERLVVAWGPASKLPKRLRTRFRAILNIADPLGKQTMSIGAPAKDGHPCHPLMLPYERTLQPWRPAL